MYCRVPGNDAGVLDSNIPPAEVSDESAGFLDEQAARRDIPGRQLLFPESIEPAGRYISQVQRRRTRTPNSTRAPGHSAKLPQVRFKAGHITKGKAGADNRELRIVNS